MRRKYTKEVLTEAVANSESVMGVMRCLGLQPIGGNHTHISKRIREYEIDTSHFLGQAHNKGKSSAKKGWKHYLVLQPKGANKTKAHYLRRAMVEYGIEYVCIECGQEPTWNGKPLLLYIDHINGNTLDHRVDNVRFLCYHCHSQTDNFSGRKNKV